MEITNAQEGKTNRLAIIPVINNRRKLTAAIYNYLPGSLSFVIGSTQSAVFDF